MAIQHLHRFRIPPMTFPKLSCSVTKSPLAASRYYLCNPFYSLWSKDELTFASRGRETFAGPPRCKTEIQKTRLSSLWRERRSYRQGFMWSSVPRAFAEVRWDRIFFLRRHQEMGYPLGILNRNNWCKKHVHEYEFTPACRKVVAYKKKQGPMKAFGHDDHHFEFYTL